MSTKSEIVRQCAKTFWSADVPKSRKEFYDYVKENTDPQADIQMRDINNYIDGSYLIGRLIRTSMSHYVLGDESTRKMPAAHKQRASNRPLDVLRAAEKCLSVQMDFTNATPKELQLAIWLIEQIQMFKAKALEFSDAPDTSE